MNKDETDTNPTPKPLGQPGGQPFGTKKVFDVVRPGKSPASPTSRPVIVGHKPPVKDDQLVQNADSRYATDNPFDQHALMSHKTAPSFETEDSDSSDSGSEPTTPSTDAKQAASTESTSKLPDLDIPDELFKETSNDTDSAAPAQPDAATTSQPSVDDEVEPALPEPTKEETPDEVSNETSDDHDAEPGAEDSENPKSNSPDSSEGSDSKPAPETVAMDQTVEKPTEPVQDKDLALAAAEANKAASEFEKSKPTTDLDVDELPQLGPDDVVAATGAPQIDHAFVVQHKTKTSWWEWLLIILMIVVLGLVALNFLLDAEVIKTTLNIPHTHLIK
jgi:hypothetical protein